MKILFEAAKKCGVLFPSIFPPTQNQTVCQNPRARDRPESLTGLALRENLCRWIPDDFPFTTRSLFSRGKEDGARFDGRHDNKHCLKKQK